MSKIKNFFDSPLDAAVEILSDEYQLRESKLLVAVSGGPDSLALLYSLHSLSLRCGIQLHGAHLNHSLRGETSDREAGFVAKQFEKLNLHYTIGRENVIALKQREKISLEDAARRARYKFLSRLSVEVQAKAIATGHTYNDQAETILMHILRGSGLSGLKGMSVLTNMCFEGFPCRLFRPLLGISRQEIIEYNHKLGLHPLSDESNLDLAFVRNKLRNQLIPKLKEINPAINRALVTLGRNVTVDDEFINVHLGSAWEDVASVTEEGLVKLDACQMQSLGLSLQGRIVRKAVESVKGDLCNITNAHIEQILMLCMGAAGKKLNLPGGIIFEVGYGEAFVRTSEMSLNKFPEFPNSFTIKIPGVTKAGDWMVKTELRSDDCGIRGLPNRQCLDYGVVGDRLWARQRKPGDRFQPHGMNNYKKLQDFMVDSKIPREIRDRVPLVVSDSGIAWVVGHRVSQWALIGENTDRHICVSFDTL